MTKRYFDTIFVVLLFCVFVVSSAVMLLYGLGVYRTIQFQSDESYRRQTAMLYLVNKVQQNDCGGVRVKEFSDGTQALLLDCEIEGEVYTTTLYCYDGQLREMFTPSNITLGVETGIPLVELDQMSVKEEEGYLRVVLKTSDAVEDTVIVAPMSESREVK